MEQILRYFWTESKPWLFCLMLFLLSRLLIWPQAAFINTAFHLHLAPEAWFWQWDSAWYLRIIQHGYDVTPQPGAGGMANYVFFPLLPLTVGFLSHITQVPIMWMGILFSQLCFLLSFYLLYQILAQRCANESTARFGVLLLAFSPCNIYFSSFYTESLFLLLSLAIWRCAYAQQWLWAGILGALLSATRPTGVMILLPLALIAWKFYRQQQLKTSVILIGLVPAGALAFMIYLHFHVGHALAFVSNDETAWRRPGLHLLHPQLYGASFKAVFALIISLYLIYQLVVKRYWPEALYFLVMIYPPIMSGSLTSFLRYSFCLFSFYFALAVISQGKHYLRLLLFSASVAYVGLFIALWVNGLPMQ